MSAPPAPSTPCAHCGLPIGKTPVGTDPYYCCRGCETVYRVLVAGGLADTYYRLNEISPNVVEACPAPEKPDALLLAELDTAEFVDGYTKLQAGGTRSTQLYLGGVHCAACVWLVERLPSQLPGVTLARLDLPRALLYVEWDPDRTSLSVIGRWLAGTGYPVQPRVRARSDAAIQDEKRMLVRVGVCWALAGNVMLIAFALYSGLAAEQNSSLRTAAVWLSMLLTIPAILYGGSIFFRRAWASIRIAWKQRSIRHLHMDTPISIGIIAGFMDSAWSTVTGRGEIWFDSITVLIAALLTARWIQLRSRRIAGDAADQLLALLPTMARGIFPDGERRIVRSNEIDPGVPVEVESGEIIPVDGVLARGSTYVNNAVLTGESNPVFVAEGDSVWAGTTNISEKIELSTRARGNETRIGRLLSWISEQHSTTAPVSRLTMQLSGYFVITVLGLAAVTFAIWAGAGWDLALRHTVALLVITCPCALGMATPLALAIGSGRAARRGIFIKNQAAIELLTRVDTIVLDKTGTLTEGNSSIVDRWGSEEAIPLAAVLEHESHHPVARAIRREISPSSAVFEQRPDDVEEHAGEGIEGTVDGHLILVGKMSWIRRRGVDITAEAEAREHEFASRGATPVVIVRDARLIGILAVSDRIQQDAAHVVDVFRRSGRAVFLCTGDHEEVAVHVATRTGIGQDSILSRASPDDKLEMVRNLQQDGHWVAMIGDGINDTSALQQADVGIAVEGSATAGQVAADIYITARGIGSVLRLFDGTLRIMTVIRRNLGLSLVYNTAGAAVAMAGWITPLVAAVAMPLSSLTVVVLSIVQKSFQSRT